MEFIVKFALLVVVYAFATLTLLGMQETYGIVRK